MEKGLKLSEVIAKLQDIKSKHGDIHVSYAELGSVVRVTTIVVGQIPHEEVVLYGD